MQKVYFIQCLPHFIFYNVTLSSEKAHFGVNKMRQKSFLLCQFSTVLSQ